MDGIGASAATEGGVGRGGLSGGFGAGVETGVRAEAGAADVAARPPGTVHAPEEVWAAYERMSHQLRRVTYRVLQDGHEAEDAVHDAVLAAYHGIHRLRDTERLDGWLIRIARNMAATQVRKRRRCHPNTRAVDDTGRSGEPLTRVTHRFGSSEPSPEQVVAVRAAIETLSVKLRATLRDRVERGLSLAEIAAEQGVTVSCVKARVARLMARMQDCL